MAARILLHDNQLCERGTTTSMLDYGRALRERGHDVEISYWRDSPANVPAVIGRVTSEFVVHAHTDRFKLDDAASSYDAGYFIKSGQDDGLVLAEGHSLVHAVFQVFEPHGSRYAYISRWLAESMRADVGAGGPTPEVMNRALAAQETGCTNALQFEYLNLIVDTPSPQLGIRQQLGIPEDAFVMLRFGGQDTFDIGWAQQTVVQMLDRHRDWYFVGLNTNRFTTHERALFLPMVMDPVEKASIIAAADVFITARGQGEAFGMAIAEALQIGTPVLAWNGGTDRNHVQMLDGLGALFRKPWDLRWRLRRLAAGKDPASVGARQARGDEFRPSAVTPRLEAMLGLST
ncbi:hypothetical protein N9C58_00045 [bacterium]|nr:hypothetical protein [bacterium]